MHCRAAMRKHVCSLAVVLCGKQAEGREQGRRGGATRAAASARMPKPTASARPSLSSPLTHHVCSEYHQLPRRSPPAPPSNLAAKPGAREPTGDWRWPRSKFKVGAERPAGAGLPAAPAAAAAAHHRAANPAAAAATANPPLAHPQAWLASHSSCTPLLRPVTLQH